MFTERQLFYRIIMNIVQGAVTMILIMLVIGILSGRISEISNSVYENEKLSQALQRRSENIGYLKQDLNRIGKIDEKIEAAFPRSENILSFVDDMEALAARHSMKQSFRFGGTSPAPQTNLELSIIEYNFTLTGNIDQLTNYLTDFEKMPYFAQASSVNMSSPNGWSYDSQIDIQGKLYIRIK